MCRLVLYLCVWLVKQSALVGVSMGDTVFCSLIKLCMTLPVGTETVLGSDGRSVPMAVIGGVTSAEHKNSQADHLRDALEHQNSFLCILFLASNCCFYPLLCIRATFVSVIKEKNIFSVHFNSSVELSQRLLSF